jgi:hypothetical protein
MRRARLNSSYSLQSNIIARRSDKDADAFALSQFPIYLSPQLLKPMVGRMREGRSLGNRPKI